MNEETKKLVLEQGNSAEVAQLANYGYYFYGTLAIIFLTMLLIGMSIVKNILNRRDLTNDEVVGRIFIALPCIALGLAGLINSLSNHFFYLYLPGSAL